MASDANHWWGGDLVLSPSGDIATVAGLDKDNQRIVRRLCTNGDQSGAQIAEYWFHPTYGGSAPWYIGQAVDPLILQGVIRSQVYLEPSVAHSPEPQITTNISPNGSFVATIEYTDAITGTALPPLTFNVTE